MTQPRRPAVARLLASYACAAVAVGLPWPLLTVRAWEDHGAGPHGALVVGLAAAARMLPYVALSWAVGSLGDRWRRDRLVRVTLVLRLLLLLGAAVALHGGAVVPALVTTSLAVAVGTPTYPAIAAALPGLAGPHRAEATRLLVTVEVSAWVVGPAIGGLLLTPGLRGRTFPIAVVMSAASVVLARRLRLPGPVGLDAAGGQPIGGMLRAVARRRPVVGALATAALLNVVMGAAALVLLPLTDRIWHQGPGAAAGFGAATAWLGFGALGAPLLWWLRRQRRSRALLALAGAFVLVALTPFPTTALPVLALAGACAVVVEAAATEVVQQLPDCCRAGALGLADSLMVGGALAGALTGPVLAQSVGPRSSLLLCAVLAVVPAGSTMLACRSTAIPSVRRVGSGWRTAGPRPRTAWRW